MTLKQLVPIAHHLKTRNNILVPVIRHFKVKRVLIEDVENLTGNFYESINCIWFNAPGDWADWEPSMSFSITMTYAVAGLYWTGAPTDEMWPYTIHGDAVGFVGWYDAHVPGVTWEPKSINGYGEGVIITKAPLPSYAGSVYGYDPSVNISALSAEKQICELSVSGHWDSTSQSSPLLAERPVFWFSSSTGSQTGIYPRPRNGYPAGMKDVIWWIYSYKHVTNGVTIQELTHPAMQPAAPNPFPLGVGTVGRQVVANEYKYAPWERYPTL